MQLEQAEGQLHKDQALASRKQAQRIWKATARLLARSQSNKSMPSESTVDQAAGAIKTDQGAAIRQLPQLNIAYCTRVKAPLTGKIGFRLIDQGNIVHASDTTPVAVITQLQPITVVFSLPEDNLQQGAQGQFTWNCPDDRNAYNPGRDDKNQQRCSRRHR